MKDAVSDASKKAADAGISMMLLGSVAFMMALFYLVNHHDEDMVKYSWQVISATISIFSAVLLFQGVNGVVEEYFLEGQGIYVELGLGVLQFLLWFALLQLSLAYMSGSMSHGPVEITEDQQQTIERNLKCYSVLLGHIAGFAAINAFAVLQQAADATWLAFAIAPAGWLVVYILSQMMSVVREHVNMADDGELDEAETLWDEVTAETEDDVVGLVVSFTMVQAFRLLIGGTLPNEEGEEPSPERAEHTNWQVFMLSGLGYVAFSIEFMRMKHNIRGHQTYQRFINQTRNVIVMFTAWCWFFSWDWFISHNLPNLEHGMSKQVVLALAVTATSMLGIFVVDQWSDLPTTDAVEKRALRTLARALGMLIGFGWEKAFDKAIATVSSFAKKDLDPVMLKLFLAVTLSALVVPAWRWFILPTVIKFDEEDEMLFEAEMDARQEAAQEFNALKAQQDAAEEDGSSVPEAPDEQVRHDVLNELQRAKIIAEARARVLAAKSGLLDHSETAVSSPPLAKPLLENEECVWGDASTGSAKKLLNLAASRSQISSLGTPTRSPRLTPRRKAPICGVKVSPRVESSNVLSAEDAVALRRRCDQFVDHIGVLERRNARLESSLDGIVKELGELRRLWAISRGAAPPFPKAASPEVAA